MTAATLAKARQASASGVDSIFHAWLATERRSRTGASSDRK